MKKKEDKIKFYTYPEIPLNKVISTKDLKRYYKFIEERKRRKLPSGSAIDKHHIIPKSLNGSNEAENLIELSIREHFIAHLILWKTFGGSMAVAFWYFSGRKKFPFKISSRVYQTLKEEIVEIQKNRWKDEKYRENHSNKTKGRKLSEETKEKIREKHIGKIWVKKEENRKLINFDELQYYHEKGWERGSGMTPMKNKSHSIDTILKMKQPHDRKKGLVIINDGKNYFWVEENEVTSYLFEGYCLGKGSSSNENTIVMNDGINKFFVKKEDVERKQKEGYEIGMPPSQEGGTTTEKKLIHKGDHQIFVKKEVLNDYLEEGYLLGSGKENVSNTKGKKAMNDGNKQFYVFPEEVFIFKQMGFKEGGLKRNGL